MVIKLDTEENTFSKHLFGIFQQHLCQKAQPCKRLWLQRYFVHSCSIITQKSLNRSFRFGWSFPFLKIKNTLPIFTWQYILSKSLLKQIKINILIFTFFSIRQYYLSKELFLKCLWWTPFWELAILLHWIANVYRFLCFFWLIFYLTNKFDFLTDNSWGK